MDWHRWIRSAEHQIELLERSIITTYTGHAVYLENMRELVKQVEDVHGRAGFPQGDSDPLSHSFTPSLAEPWRCDLCTLRRIMHDTDESPGSRGVS